MRQPPKVWLGSVRARVIRKKATELLRAIHYKGGAVPIERIANHMNATIRYAPYDGELAGMLIRKGRHAVIGVNSAHHKNRQRFTIAHECGHLLLHSDDLFVDKNFTVFNRDASSSNADNLMEVEANQFAAEILMPRQYLLEDLRQNDIDLEDDSQIGKIAKNYAVSTQAMTYRTANLFMMQLSYRQ